ncbi:lipid II-degrading bacteriocin [Pseudomonas cichorii]|uniref:lipid II-degrading bacteriocin n=1 Tax=Pseudomonas cichorii TaxID=36746 RepID=UPI000F001831|nr:lipid II-degrading bacteriocin [Pseudomonas cichorii]
MTVELPNIYVYPDDYGTVSGVTRINPLMGGMQALMQARAQRDVAYLAGNWWSIVNSQLKMIASNRPPYCLAGMMADDFHSVAYADFIKTVNPGVSNEDALAAGRSDGLRKKAQALATPEFSGGIFTPIKALMHFLQAEGTPATVPLNRTGIKPAADKIPDLMAIIRTARIGKTSVDLTVPYYTGQDSFTARMYLGSITIRITGEVIHTASGVISFVGEVRAYNDVYDANRSQHRNDFDERATKNLREMERVSGAVPYEIKMPGSIPISYSNQ